MNVTSPGGKFHKLDDGQRLDWLRLIRSQNVGPSTFRDLITRYGSAARALEAIPDLAMRGGAISKIKICTIADAEQEIERLSYLGIRLVGMGEPAYPAALRAANGCPPLLSVRGNLKLLSQAILAVVGSRNASIAGMKITHQFCQGVGASGHTIVSGLARGIDTTAHKASLKTGTIAVFAGGIDHVYPEENRSLVDDIVQNNGTIISEMPLGWKPRAQDFPRRNRIIMGLAQAVLVIEAARRSGSLITARLANEEGRIVMAVPGSPLDPRSEGTNHLIQNGATLITSVNDILETLSPMLSSPIHEKPGLFESDDYFPENVERIDRPAPENLKQRILYALGPTPVHIDDIVEFSEARPGEVHMVLLELDLAGHLERHFGGMVSLVKS